MRESCRVKRCRYVASSKKRDFFLSYKHSYWLTPVARVSDLSQMDTNGCACFLDNHGICHVLFCINQVRCTGTVSLLFPFYALSPPKVPK